LILLALLGFACGVEPARLAPRDGLVELSTDLEPLRRQFESDRDRARAIVLLSPT
jgi:hypothetical protein